MEDYLEGDRASEQSISLVLCALNLIITPPLGITRSNNEQRTINNQQWHLIIIEIWSFVSGTTRDRNYSEL